MVILDTRENSKTLNTLIIFLQVVFLYKYMSLQTLCSLSSCDHRRVYPYFIWRLLHNAQQVWNPMYQILHIIFFTNPKFYLAKEWNGSEYIGTTRVGNEMIAITIHVYTCRTIQDTSIYAPTALAHKFNTTNSALIKLLEHYSLIGQSLQQAPELPRYLL